MGVSRSNERMDHKPGRAAFLMCFCHPERVPSTFHNEDQERGAASRISGAFPSNPMGLVQRKDTRMPPFGLSYVEFLPTANAKWATGMSPCASGAGCKPS